MNKSDLQKAYRASIDKMFEFMDTDIQIWLRKTKTGVAVDPISGEPLNPNDEAWLLEATAIRSIVRWSDHQILERFPGGTSFKGDVVITVYAKDVEKNPADPGEGTILADAEHITVDGVDCEMKATPRRSGFPTPYVYHAVLERTE